MSADQDREAIQDALAFLAGFGDTDGAHHKQWAIDQVVRILTRTPEEYERFVRAVKNGEDGPDTYDWEEGQAP